MVGYRFTQDHFQVSESVLKRLYFDSLFLYDLIVVVCPFYIFFLIIPNHFFHLCYFEIFFSAGLLKHTHFHDGFFQHPVVMVHVYFLATLQDR